MSYKNANEAAEAAVFKTYDAMILIHSIMTGPPENEEEKEAQELVGELLSIVQNSRPKDIQENLYDFFDRQGYTEEHFRKHGIGSEDDDEE